MQIQPRPFEQHVPVQDTWLLARRAREPPRGPSTTLVARESGPGHDMASLSVGLLLQQARVAARLSQQELADRVSVAVKSIQLIETGRTRFPTRNVLRRISSVLGVDLVVHL
jgi:ribosome-binding protein aMBF1 (putative translation factor)